MLDQLSQIACGAIMDTVCLAGKFTGAKQAVDPPQVFADCSFARDSFL